MKIDDVANKSKIIELSHGQLTLALAPACGGSIYSFRLHQPGKTIELMRPAPATTPADCNVLSMACFPLVPFSNRVEQGTFVYENREIVLAPSPALPDSYPLHGHGWQNAWQVSALNDNSAILNYTHSANAGDGWPWAYRAVQEFKLTASALTVTLSLTNLDNKKMPCGIGLHPYFPADQTTRVYAGLEGVWLTDEHCIPVKHTSIPTAWDFNRDINPCNLTIDNCFTNWNGKAAISRPGAQLVISHSGLLRSLVIYTPANENFFCLEPVSNITNAFNMPADEGTGLIELEPNQECKATVNFEVKTTT